MAATLENLHQAATSGDIERVRRLLAAAPDPAALIAAPLVADNFKWTVLDSVASLPSANLEMLRLLIDCNPAAAAAQSPEDWTPLHLAVDCGSAEAVQLLLEVAPASATRKDSCGATPLESLMGLISSFGFWDDNHRRSARLLLAAPGQDPRCMHQSLNVGRPLSLPLFPDVVARYPLTPADWQLIPSPCPDLAAVLPIVLLRLPAEAALLVARLPRRARRRLRTAALSLHRAQATLDIFQPQQLVWRILAACLAS